MDQYVEAMKSYNLDMSEKCIDSWKDDNMRIGDMSFVVSMKTITMLMGLLAEGNVIPCHSNGHYKPDLK